MLGHKGVAGKTGGGGGRPACRCLRSSRITTGMHEGGPEVTQQIQNNIHDMPAARPQPTFLRRLAPSASRSRFIISSTYALKGVRLTR